MSLRAHYYSLISQFYPIWFKTMQKRVKEWTIEAYKPYKAQDILEIGVGSGEIFSVLLTSFPSSRITGIDISSRMIYQCHQKIKNISHPAFSIENADIKSWKSDNRKYDLIICNFVLDTFSKNQRHQAFTNIQKIASPNAVICITTLHSGRNLKEKLIPFLGSVCPLILGFARPIPVVEELKKFNFKILSQHISSHNGLAAQHVKARYQHE